MIKLDYYLSPEDIAWSSRDVWDLKNADEITFTNNVFRANQTLLINRADFSNPTLYLIWFVWEMTRGIADLANGATDFDFWDTEGPDKIFFKMDDGLVSIRANYTEATATVPLDELQSALHDYARRVRKELCSQFPDLKENAWLAEHYPSSGRWLDSCGKYHGLS